MRHVLLVLICLLLGPAAHGEDAAVPMSVAPLRLDQATVLASRGTPRALQTFLPRSEAPRPLAWPLPEGPVLLLGLPETDPLAREIALALGVIDEDTDLGGGWRIQAWRDGARPLVMIVASDAAALYAARTELDPARPLRMGMGPRSMDYTAPNEEAGVLVAPGRREHIPLFRIRGREVDPTDRQDVAAAIGSHANRALVRLPEHPDGQHRRGLDTLRAAGIVPVLWPRRLPARLHPILEAQLERAARLGVTRMIRVEGRRPIHVIQLAKGPTGTPTLEVRARVVARGFPLPPAHPPTIPHRTEVGFGTPPEDLLANTDPQGWWYAETWNRSAADVVPEAPPWSMRRLHGHAEGYLALGLDGNDALLATAWDGDESRLTTARAHLRALAPMDVEDPLVFVDALAANLRQAAVDTLGAHPWMTRVADHLARRRPRLAKEDLVLLPTAPVTLTMDGRLDEPAWRHAVPLPGLSDDTLRVQALVDARGLCLGVRIRDSEARAVGIGRDPLPHGVDVHVAWGPRTPRRTPTPPAADRSRTPVVMGLPLRASNRGSRTRPDGQTVEFRLDRTDFQGDVHLGRALQLTLRLGTARARSWTVVIGR